MTFGPNPWQQTSWDWRAAGNFIGGGAGSGLIVFTALAGVGGATAAALLVGGLALIGLGLVCVWAELGRPLRALHVFFSPRSSWMTREAIAATLLMPVGAAGAAASYAGYSAAAWPAAALALVFVYCQGRMLQAARGIAAWRAPSTAALLVGTALAEGAGLFWLVQPGHSSAPLAIVFGALLIARAAIWTAYRRQLVGCAAPALRALDRAGLLLWVAGTVPPLVLVVLAFLGISGAMAVAGLVAALAGAYLKFTLITRAGYNQGFALQALPVRGARP